MNLGGSILISSIFGFYAIVMSVLGICALFSKKPCGFYTFEKTPSEQEITDVSAWNRKHGIMFISCGIWISILILCGLLIESSLLLVFVSIGLLFALPTMIVYHSILVKKYHI